MKEPRITLTPISDDCNGVDVWFEELGLNVEFTAKGCIELRSFDNGKTPDDQDGEADGYMHVCDMTRFIETLKRARDIADKQWKPI